MTDPISKQNSLANTHKSRFISMLQEKFATVNFFVKQADNDAYVWIIETATE